MPQPRRPRQPPPPPSVDQVAAGGAAATAAPAAGLATGGVAAAGAYAAGHTAATVAAAQGAQAVAQATSLILGGLARFFRRSRASDLNWLYASLRQAHPSVTDDELRRIARDEVKLEAEFQAKALRRWREALPRILAMENPEDRAAAMRNLQEREARYLRMRHEAMAERATARVERRLLRELSPTGAFWVLSPYPKTHTLDCIVLAGRFHPWEFLDKVHPPLHHGCFPAGVTVAGLRARGSTARWYAGDLIELDFASGNHLSVTPNHPVLTGRGWVPAGELHEGDDVVRGDFSKLRVAGDPDEHQVPALIEEVAAAVGEASGVEPRSVEVAAHYFHGDGVGSEVCVVRTDGRFQPHGDAALLDPRGQSAMVGHDVDGALLAGLRRAAERIEAVGTAALRGLGGLSVEPVLLGGAGSVAGAVDLSYAAALDTGSVQPQVDRDAADAEAARKARDAFAGEVATDYVVGVERHAWAGHVYNLETDEGWYIANGVIVHNCPCMLLGADEAIARGLMSAADIPSDPKAAARKALADYKRAKELEEAVGSEQIEAWQANGHSPVKPANIVSLTVGHLIQEARRPVVYDEGLHPRDRLGRWIRTLGFKAYKVGGAVRDPLLGKKPKDEDFVVMASPAQIKAAVEREGGTAHELVVRDRVVGVRAHVPGVTPPEGVEIAPPRIEVSTGPSRHDFVIEPHPAVMPLERPERKVREDLTYHEGGDMMGDQWNGWISAFDGDRLVGHLDWDEWQGEIRVRNIEVEEDRQREGIATSLIAKLEAKFPDTVIGTSGYTPEGRAWATAIGRDDERRGRDPIEDDARRRDFTANAIYQDVETGELVDPLYGVSDIEGQTLHVISDTSFSEDPLRILRGLRFQAQHDLYPSEETLEQMTEHASSVTALTQGGVSGTAQSELNKMLMGEHVGKALRTMRDTGVMAHFLPELAPVIGFDQESKYHDLTLDEHIISVVENTAKLDAPLEVRLAALFHDSGKPAAAFRGKDGRLHYYGDETHPEHAVAGAEIARAALKRLNYPEATIDRVERLVRHHMVTASGTRRPGKIRRWRAEVGADLVDDLLTLRRADIASKDGEGSAEHVAELERFAELVRAEQDAPTTRADLAVTGKDLIDAGIKPGPEMGRILDSLLHDVISEPSLNNRDWLLAQALRRRMDVTATTVSAPDSFRLGAHRDKLKAAGVTGSIDGDGGWWSEEQNSEIADALIAALDRYPVLRNPQGPTAKRFDGMSRTSGTLGIDRPMSVHLGEHQPMAVATTADWDYHVLVLNDQYPAIRPISEDPRAQGTNGGLAEATADTMAGGVWHEVGHMLAWAAGLDDATVEQFARDAYHAEFMNNYGITFDEVAALSDYAASSPQEAFAELSAMFHTPGYALMLEPELREKAEEMFGDLEAMGRDETTNVLNQLAALGDPPGVQR